MQAVESLKKGWREFRSDPSGERFQKRYERRRQKRGPKSISRLLYAGVGLLLVLGGVFFMLVPGPGIPLFLLGIALVAGESARFARWLDQMELRWRRRRS